MRRCVFTLLIAVLIVTSPSRWLLSQAPAVQKPQVPTAAIVFGVGSPNINAERSGTSIGIVAGGTLYVFDAGAGVERRIMEAAPKLAAMGVGKFGPVFLTHLDMDHVLGLAALLYYHDFAATGQLSTADPDRGAAALTVYGPG